MCVIVSKPAGVELSESDITDMFWVNPDGFGVSWAKEGRVRTYRALPKTGKAAWACYQALNLHDVHAVLHFRMATHGSVRLENTHPFEVVPGVVMSHNGVLDTRKLELDCKGDITDSLAYARSWLKPLLEQARDPLAMLRSGEFQALIGGQIGSSKLAFVDREGHVSLINDHLGHIRKRPGGTIWVSNTFWENQGMGYLWEKDGRGWSKTLPKAQSRYATTSAYAGEDVPVSHVCIFLEQVRDVARLSGLSEEGITLEAVEDYIYDMGIVDAQDALDEAKCDPSKVARFISDVVYWALPDDEDEVDPMTSEEAWGVDTTYHPLQLQ
jgi:hypothetical protein